MGIFNDNIRFWRLQMGLSQEDFAGKLGIKRGKLSAYEASTEPRTDFYEQIAKDYNINLQLFLTVRMTEDNYQSFFTTKNTGYEQSDDRAAIVKESDEGAFKVNSLFDLIHRVKNSNNFEERNQLTERIISMLGKVLEENSTLRQEMVELYKKLEKAYRALK